MLEELPIFWGKNKYFSLQDTQIIKELKVKNNQKILEENIEKGLQLWEREDLFMIKKIDHNVNDLYI